MGNSKTKAKSFVHMQQESEGDCGIACAAMIISSLYKSGKPEDRVAEAYKKARKAYIDLGLLEKDLKDVLKEFGIRIEENPEVKLLVTKYKSKEAYKEAFKKKLRELGKSLIIGYVPRSEDEYEHFLLFDAEDSKIKDPSYPEAMDIDEFLNEYYKYTKWFYFHPIELK